MESSLPALSVVLLIGDQRARAQRALDSVLQQDCIDRIEVLLIDLTRRRAPPLAGHDDARLRRIPISPGAGYPQARAVGTVAARAPYVAFLEEHTEAMPGWAAGVLRGFEQGWTAVAYEAHNLNPGAGISNASFLANYMPWLAPAQRGPVDFVASQNAAYRRDVLMRYADQLPQLYGNDQLLQWKLAADGHRFGIEPEARFKHRNETQLRVIARGLFLYNRFMAPMRASLFDWNLLRRCIYAFGLPLIPFVRLFKQTLFLRRQHPHQMADFLRAAPWILASNYSAAAGQTVGLLFGPGDALSKFSDYEINADR
jgi:hypothetical protein